MKLWLKIMLSTACVPFLARRAASGVPTAFKMGTPSMKDSVSTLEHVNSRTGSGKVTVGSPSKFSRRISRLRACDGGGGGDVEGGGDGWR